MKTFHWLIVFWNSLIPVFCMKINPRIIQSDTYWFKLHISLFKLPLKLSSDIRHHPTDNWRKWGKKVPLLFPVPSDRLFGAKYFACRTSAHTRMRALSWDLVVGSQVTEALRQWQHCSSEAYNEDGKDPISAHHGEKCKKVSREPEKERKKQPWSYSLRFIVYKGKAETIAVFG